MGPLARLLPVSRLRRRVLTGLLCAVALALHVSSRWEELESGGLAPRGGGLLKDLLGFAMCLLPKHSEVGGLLTPSDATLESFHAPTDSPDFAENFYFWAHQPGAGGADPNVSYTTRLAFQGPKGDVIWPFFQLNLGGEVWDLPPEFWAKTLPRQGDLRRATAPGVGELTFNCTDPMRRWHLTYRGELAELTTGKRTQADASFEVLLRPKAFRFQKHWDALSAGRAMAGVPWTASFWNNLRKQHQERYASAGQVRGVVQLDGRSWNLELVGSRDHNFGVRSWDYLTNYIWFPPLVFDEPIVLDRVPYTYMAGAMTMYGDTLNNMVIGGLMADDGSCASWAAATPIREIAPAWYDAPPGKPYESLGHLVPPALRWTVQLAGGVTLEITNERGWHHGLWEHGFFNTNGSFEIYEAQTRWAFRVLHKGQLLQRLTATGLLEFGKRVTPSVHGHDQPLRAEL